MNSSVSLAAPGAGLVPGAGAAGPDASLVPPTVAGDSPAAPSADFASVLAAKDAPEPPLTPVMPPPPAPADPTATVAGLRDPRALWATPLDPALQGEVAGLGVDAGSAEATETETDGTSGEEPEETDTTAAGSEPGARSLPAVSPELLVVPPAPVAVLPTTHRVWSTASRGADAEGATDVTGGGTGSAEGAATPGAGVWPGGEGGMGYLAGRGSRGMSPTGAAPQTDVVATAPSSEAMEEMAGFVRATGGPAAGLPPETTGARPIVRTGKSAPGMTEEAAVTAALSTPRPPPPEELSTLPPGSVGLARSRELEGKYDFLNAGEEPVTMHGKSFGIAAANRVPNMTKDETFSPLSAAGVAVAAAPVNVVPFPTSEVLRTTTTAAPTPAAAIAVIEEVTQVSQMLRDLGPTSVEVEIPVDGGQHVAVRIELRDGIVHAAFRAPNAEWKDALTTQWPPAAESARETAQVRFADPVFSDASGQGSQHSPGWQQRRRARALIEAEGGIVHGARSLPGVVHGTFRDTVNRLQALA